MGLPGGAKGYRANAVCSAAMRRSFQKCIETMPLRVESRSGTKAYSLENAMNRTPNDQRSDALNPTSGDHKDMLDNRSAQIKQSIDDKGNKQQGGSGDAFVSVPPETPKE